MFNASERTYNWRPVTIEYSDENFIAIKDEFDANAPADKKRGLQEGEEIHLSPLTQAESLKDDEVQNNRKNGESNGKPDAKKGDTLNLEEGVTNKGATELDKADPQEKPQLVGQPRDFGLTIEQRRKWLTAMDEVKAKINSVTDDVHSGRLSPTRMATLYSEALDAHRLSVKAFLTGEQMKKYDKWMDPQRKELKAAKLKTGPTKKPGTGAKDATETNNSEPDTTKTETAKPQTTKPSTTEDSTASATDNAKAKDEPADFALTDEQRKQWTTSRSVFEEAKKNATNELAAGKLTSTTLRDRFMAIFEADRESVQKFLTPDQLAKYDEWIKPQKSIFGL